MSSRPDAEDGSVRSAPDGGVVTDVGFGSGTRAVTRRGVHQLLGVARQEYALSLRNRWAVALTVLFAALSVLVVALGQQGGVVRADAVVVSLVELSTFLLPLAALVFGYDVVVGHDEAGWLGVLFALPVPRRRVVHGAFLGRFVTFGGAVVVGFGTAGLWLALGGSLPPAYLGFVAAAVLAGGSFLALATLVSTVAAEKTHALGGVLLLWVWFALVHDLLALGLVVAEVVPSNWLPALVLLNPAAVFRVLALQGAPTVAGGMADVLVGSGLTTPVLVATLVAWTLVPMWLAGRRIVRRSI